MSSYGPISSVCPAMNDRGDHQEPLVPAKYHGILLKASLSTLTHPMDNPKLLIQIGHEPIAPWPKKTLFGRPALRLPSVFGYMGHIRRRDGYLALYRGWAPKMASLGLS